MRRYGVLLIVLAGCSTTGMGGFPGRFRDVPGRDGVIREKLQEARDQLAADAAVAALATVDELLRQHPDHVNVHRLRQDILRQRGRLGLVLHEAEARRQRRPASAAARYLMGRVEETTAAKAAAFAAAIDLDRSNFWGWYGLAFTLRGSDNARANRIYAGLYAQSEHDPHIGSAYAQSLRGGRRAGDALRVYGQVAHENAGLGAVGMAEVLIGTGKRPQAWPHLLTALRERPFDGVVHALIARLLAHGLPTDGVQELLDVVRADRSRMQAFASRSPGLLAGMFRDVGEADAARALLRQSRRLTATERRDLRRLLIQCGRVDAFLADVAAEAVPAFLADEANQVRARWQALLAGPWMGQPDPLAIAAQATELVRVLVHLGYLDYADLIASKALLRHAAGPANSDAPPALELLQEEIRKEIAFESALRRRLTRGYTDFARKKQAASLATTLDDLRKLSTEILGKDVVGEPELFELPFVGTLVDSLGPGLPAHFAKYNKHLVMGQRNSGPVEGMILVRLSMRHVDPVAGVPLPPRTTEVVGENRQLQPLNQGDLAGIALLNHYVVDMDEVRAWAASVARRRRIAREDDGVLLRDPLPAAVDPLAPAGVEWRLAVLSPVQDKDLDAAILDIIRWHEQGHMVDFQHFLPVGVHPLRALALTLRNGLSALGVASEMEGRAELVALATSPHTRLVAAHIAGFLHGDSGESPHARGFRSLVEQMLEQLADSGVEDVDVRYWHRVEPHILRAAAGRLLKRLW